MSTTNPTNSRRRPNPRQYVPADRYAADKKELERRLTQTAAVNTKARHWLDRRITSLASSQLSDHDAIVELQQRVGAMQDLTQKGTPLPLAASIVGFTSEEIHTILELKDDEDLTDSTLVTGMLNRIGWLSSNVDTLNEVLAQTRGIVNAHSEVLGPNGQNFTNLSGRVDGLETTSHTMNEQLTTIRNGDSFPKEGFFIAAAAWLVVSILWASHTWKETAAVKVGSTKGSATLLYRYLNSGWAALVIGFAAALIVLFLVSLIPSKHTEKITKSVKSRSRSTKDSTTAQQQATTVPTATQAAPTAPVQQVPTQQQPVPAQP